MKQASKLKESKQTKIDLTESPPINHEQNNERQNAENPKCDIIECSKLCVST